MNIPKLSLVVLTTACLCAVSSCKDDKYDLSDIDTTTAIKLDNLVLPVNLNEITLDQVLKVDEDDPDDPIKIINGSYVIQKKGEFTADDVTVDMLEAEDYTTVDPLPLFTDAGGVQIQENTTMFSYLVNDVDPSLKSLSYLKLDEKEMMVTLDMVPNNINYNNVILEIPEGYIATYKNQEYFDGHIPVVIKNGQLDEPFYITSMTFAEPLFPKMVDGVNQLDITGPIGFYSATLDAPYNGDITANFIMYPFTANIASGTILYEIEDPEIEPVNLDDLPDFLTEGETKLILTNPQLYLSFPPMYGADYTGLMSITPNGPGTITIDPFQLNDFPVNLVVAADPSDLWLEEEYPNPVTQPNPQLQYLVYGDGLPENIDFSLTNTNLNGSIDNFELGQDIKVVGQYTFIAPLAFEAGSQILYTKKETEFFGDDAEDVLVEELRITTNATTKVPFAVNLTVYPLDKKGERIKSKTGAYITATSGISAMAQNELLDLHFTEPFNGLDGVEFSVTADDMDGQQLKPDQTIMLKNIRAKVTGEYVTKL